MTAKETRNEETGDSLEFTGERFMPGEGGPLLYYEHAHRYLIAAKFVAGKRVLDVASGEGYGSDWLAASAELVIGIDNTPVAVAHARRRYGGAQNLDFLVGDANHLPLPSDSFDVIVAFETIEHLAKPEGFLGELKRVVRKDGIVLISTPDKATHSEESQRHSDYHLREFYLGEFEKVLSAHFPSWAMIGQRVVAASLMWSLSEGANHATGSIFADIKGTPGEGAIERVMTPMYVLAVCSPTKLDSKWSKLLPSLFLDSSDAFLKQLLEHAKSQTPEVQKLEKIIRLEQEVRSQGFQLAVREESLFRLNERLLVLEKEGAEGRALKAELALIKSGFGWAVFSRLRRARHFLFPRGTLRGFVFRLLLLPIVLTVRLARTVISLFRRT